MERTENLNIERFEPLITPKQLKQHFPETEQLAHLVATSRATIQKILRNRDHRRLVIAGPCSLHDIDASVEFAQRLKDVQNQVEDQLLVIMRAYFEKPRTTLGWKGMLYDPLLDGSYDIQQGFTKARALLIQIAKIGLPTATELLDPIVPQYLADLISWAAIGARTSESQIHRQMVSGLSMPVGFKNATDGSLNVAVDAIRAAASPHCFMGIDEDAHVVIARTRGNKFGHLVLRGGTNGPNYASEYVAFSHTLLHKLGIKNGIIIDCSHANAHKDHRRQREAFMDVLQQIKDGSKSIAGLMLESFLEEGSQPLERPENLKYGLSLTDNCIGWNETEELILRFAEALR